MSISQGSIGFQNMSVPQAAPGPPFVLTSANDGLMVDPVTGKIILGEPNATPGTPSQFLGNKDLVTKGFLFRVGDVDFSANGLHWLMDDTNRRFLITDGVGDLLDLDQINGQYLIGDISNAVNGSVLNVDDGNRSFKFASGIDPYLSVDIPNDEYWIGDLNGASSSTYMYIDGFSVDFTVAGDRVLNINPSAGNYQLGAVGFGNNTHIHVNDAVANQTIGLRALNGIFTLDPTTGADGVLWELGDVKAGAVALDAANYVEVSINGVIVKLGIVV